MFVRHDGSLIVLCFVALIFSPLSVKALDDSEDVPRLPLALDVFLKKPQAQTYNLHIHLTNMSNESVNVDLHDLPWNPPNDSKWLSAVQMGRSQKLLKQHVHRWDIGSQKVPLKPGESIQGRILLNPRFPSLLKDIKEFGVQIRWECPPRALKFICGQQSLTAVSIPKGDLGHADAYLVNSKLCHQSADDIGLIKIPKDDQVLFLHTLESVMEHLPQIRALLRQVSAYVQQCQPRWTNSWSVSFFTDDKIAGFLRDVEKEQFFKEGLWQESNIGQYSSQARKLFRFPWVKNKSDEVYLSVYP